MAHNGLRGPLEIGTSRLRPWAAASAAPPAGAAVGSRAAPAAAPTALVGRRAWRHRWPPRWHGPSKLSSYYVRALQALSEASNSSKMLEIASNRCEIAPRWHFYGLLNCVSCVWVRLRMADWWQRRQISTRRNAPKSHSESAFNCLQEAFNDMCHALPTLERLEKPCKP